MITYKSHDSLLAEVFTNEGTGTLVVADDALSPAEQQARRNESPVQHHGPAQSRAAAPA